MKSRRRLLQIYQARQALLRPAPSWHRSPPSTAWWTGSLSQFARQPLRHSYRKRRLRYPLLRRPRYRPLHRTHKLPPMQHPCRLTQQQPNQPPAPRQKQPLLAAPHATSPKRRNPAGKTPCVRQPKMPPRQALRLSSPKAQSRQPLLPAYRTQPALLRQEALRQPAQS